MQSSQLVGDFLEASVDHFNAEGFLRRIPDPNRLVISDIGGKLSRLLDSRRVNKNVAEAYLSALHEDQMKMFSKQVLDLRRGIRIAPRDAFGVCATCAAPMAGEMFAAPCGHVSHRLCHLARFAMLPQQKSIRRSNSSCPTNIDGLAACLAARALGATSLEEILPQHVLNRVFSFMTPQAVNECRGLSTRMRTAVRAYTFSDDRDDLNLFRRSVTRTGFAEELRIRRTVHFASALNCGLYALKSPEQPQPLCFSCDW
jgi:hypothetical protein